MLIKKTFSKEVQDQINRLKDQVNIVGLSGGKDSMATCILMRYLDIPFRAVTAEVWWKDSISGENPYHFDFLHNKVANTLDRWGVHHDFIRSDITVLLVTARRRLKVFTRQLGFLKKQGYQIQSCLSMFF